MDVAVAPRRLLAGLAVVLLAGCGGGEIESSQITEARVLSNQPATFRDGGKLVTGTVVEKSADGATVRRTEYVDGFPSGRVEEWHPNGQKKSERVVAFVARGPQDGGLRPAGPSRTWCDNGTLQSESETATDGMPKGVSRTFTCLGEPLSEQTMPLGPVKRWAEVKDNPKTVLTEDGTTREGGGWDGVHKQYHLNGKPRLEERWTAGALDGAYRTWTEEGDALESGTYRAGTKVGTWTVNQGSREMVTEYDETLCIDPRYAQAFMTAAGIYISTGTALNNARADEERAKYFIDEKLVDVTKRLNLMAAQQGRPFSTTRWTYPVVLAATPLLSMLTAQGADLKAADSEGRNRLFYCIYSLGADRFCNGAEAKRLIGLGILPNHPDASGNTVLHEVVKTHVYIGGIVTNEKRLEVGRILMNSGADPDVANREGTTPLMLAVSARQFALATELLNRSKTPAAVDRNGMNLVHLAFYVPLSRQVSFNLTPEVRAFVTLAASKGIDPHAPIGSSGTLKDLAEQAGAIDFARFMAGLNC